MSVLNQKPASLLEPNYQTAFDTWKQNPGPKTLTPLLQQVEPEINRGISAYVGTGNPMLKSHARRLTIGALRNYDPTKAKLGTHIVNQLQGLRRIARKENTVVSVPERMQLNKAYIDRANIELEEELGREPTLDELADHTGLSRRRIMSVRTLQMPLSEGQVQSFGEEGSEFSPAVEQPQDRQDTWLWVVYDDQDTTNKKIMEWTLGLAGNPMLSNSEIARKLRITPGAVSQRKARIQNLLNQRYELGF